MKSFFLFLICVILAAGGVFYYFHQKSSPTRGMIQLFPTTTPFPTFRMEKAPSKTINAQIISLSGDVDWQSRTATQPATIMSPISVQQGESISTGDSGKTDIQLKDDTFSILANSHLSFIQTLPPNIVLNQSSGTVIYTHKGDTPLSIRSLHLLVQMEKGVETISVDTDTDIITLAVESGSANVAYNDTSLITTMQLVPEGSQFTFDDDKREFKLKKLH